MELNRLTRVIRERWLVHVEYRDVYVLSVRQSGITGISYPHGYRIHTGIAKYRIAGDIPGPIAIVKDTETWDARGIDERHGIAISVTGCQWNDQLFVVRN